MSEQESDATAVDIEAIMLEIRAQIIAQKAATGGEAVQIKLTGKHLPPAFYDHLYQAEVNYDQLALPLGVARSALPLVGPLIDRLRTELHRLVLYYVNRMAIQQMKVNNHLLRCINVLGEALEAAYEERDHSGDAG